MRTYLYVLLCTINTALSVRMCLVPGMIQHLYTYVLFTRKHRVGVVFTWLMYVLLCSFLLLFFITSLLLSSSTRRRFYPQRPFGQAVVTSVVPSPRHVRSFLSRIGFGIPTARRFSSNVANSCSRAFRYSNHF